jgi:L-threonylcarbamoyladenylate synthase
MQVVNKEEFLNSKRKFLKKMSGSLFIYPTDSIYGLGCDATNSELVDKLRKVKKSNLQPLSIIAPSKEWIKENCFISSEQKKYFDALGSKIKINNKEHCFTLILKLKNKGAVAHNVTQGSDAIGVRIPQYWFSDVIFEFGKPIITTSANPIGENFMTSLTDLNDSVKRACEFIIYEGEKRSVPSTIINLVESEIKITERKK